MSEIDFAKIVAEDAAANSGKPPAQAEQAEQVENTAEATTAPADEAAEEQSTEAAGSEPKPKKPGGGFQKRISELTREKHEALRREQETRELLAKTTAALEAVSGGRKPAASAQSDEPRPEQFDRYEDYVRASARWDAKQSVREELKGFQKQQGEQTREQAVQASYEALEAKVLKQAQTDPEVGEAFEAAKTGVLPITPTIAEYVREASDEPGLLLKYLMNNEDEANRISRLGDIAAVKELAKVEARISAKPKPKTSSAPPPPTTVGGGAAAQQSIEKMPYGDLRKMVAEWDKR